MGIIVDNLSAMHFWSRVESSLDQVSTPAESNPLPTAMANATDIARSELLEHNFGPAPLHVLVPRGHRRRNTRAATVHQSTASLPPTAFRQLQPNLHIASPELCFLELATALPYPKLIEFGYLICGYYTLNPGSAALNIREPLSSPKKIAAFLRRVPGHPGCRIASHALTQVISCSASPRETKTAMLLSLPTKRGGYGFEKPALNHRIGFTAREQQLYNRSHVVLDLYWPQQKVGIEYDGAAYHCTDEALSRDRRKSSELNCRGITVIRIDRMQTATAYQVFVLAKKLSILMGRRIRNATPQQWERRCKLYNTLMKSR